MADEVAEIITETDLFVHSKTPERRAQLPLTTQRGEGNDPLSKSTMEPALLICWKTMDGHTAELPVAGPSLWAMPSSYGIGNSCNIWEPLLP
jgi:hypothetical protein